MTAPEAESGPQGDHGTEGWPPPGWREFREDIRVLRLDLSHPDYPLRWRKGEETARRFWARLDADPAITEAVGRIKDAWHCSRPFLEQMLAESESVRERQDAPALPELKRQMTDFLQRVDASILTEATQSGPTDIPIPTKRHYLAHRCLPPQFANMFTDQTAAPVSVFVNTIPDRVSFPILLHPGEIAVMFTGTARREFDKAGPFVTEAIEILNHDKARQPGGRPSRKKDPAKAEQNRAAAKLHHWLSPGFSHAEIAEFFGWQGDERVRRAIRDGEELLDDELGPGWRSQPPPGIAERGC